MPGYDRAKRAFLASSTYIIYGVSNSTLPKLLDGKNFQGFIVRTGCAITKYCFQQLFSLYGVKLEGEGLTRALEGPVSLVRTNLNGILDRKMREETNQKPEKDFSGLQK